MWVVTERRQGNVIRIIGPFNTAQDAAKWVDTQYTKPIAVSAVIEKLVSPEDVAQY